MHINLLGKEKKQNPSLAYSVLNSKAAHYMMGAAAGLSLMIGSAAQQFINPGIILDYLAQRSQQTASMMAQNYEKQSLEVKDDNKFFSLAKLEDNSSFSLAKKEKVYFSLEGSKPTPINDLYEKKQASEKPAVLNNIDAKAGDYVLVVNKETQLAQLYKLDFVPVDETLVSTGKNPGDKEEEGDSRTPEGIFNIVSVNNSSDWVYEGELAYGPKFLRLNYSLNGSSSIGIHGTNEPELLGSPASHGCVRLDNEMISWYVQQGYLKPGTQVAVVENNEQIPLGSKIQYGEARDNLEGLLNKSLNPDIPAVEKNQSKQSGKGE